MWLVPVLKLKYFGGILNESDKDGTECRRKVVSAIRSHVNARSLHLECTRLLVLLYGSETMV